MVRQAVQGCTCELTLTEVLVWPYRERREDLVEHYRAINLPPATLERYVGQYQIAPTFIIGITREGDHLVAQVMGQQSFTIYPSSETTFFVKAADAEITFTLDAGGEVDGLILRQRGREMRGEKLE